VIADHPSQADDLACIEAVELITDYLEGALPPAQARRLEHHVETCPGCSEYVDQMRMIGGSLGGLSHDSIPAEMRNGLIAAFRESRKS
jgi:anti-sigma factor RsiW